MRSTSLFCWICYFGGARATAWQRAGPEDVSPAAQPSPSLLIGGTRALFFRTTWLPSADELFVGMFSAFAQQGCRLPMGASGAGCQQDPRDAAEGWPAREKRQ